MCRDSLCGGESMQDNNNSGVGHRCSPLDSGAVLRSTTALAGVALAFALAGGTARADEWTGAASDDWFEAGNWTDGSVPTATDEVQLDTATPNPTVVNAPGAQANYIDIGVVLGTGALTIEDGGTLTNVNATLGHNSTAQGTALVTGIGSAWSGNTLSVGQAGIGTVTIEHGGRVDYNTGYIGLALGSSGTITVSGSGARLNNGWGGTSVAVSGAGMLNIENGGVVTTGRNATIGYFANGDGTANVTGHNARWTIADDLVIGSEGKGMLTVDQGAVVKNSATLIAEQTGSTGTMNLNGVGGARGVLATHTISAGDGAAHIVFDGGTLRTLSSQPGAIGAGFALGDITVAAGGAYIDTNGRDVGFQSPLSGPGTLVKLGEGALVLFTPNTHGSTRVSEGRLVVYGTAASIMHAAGDMIVGDQAGPPAGLLITDASTVENGNGYVGQTSGSEGTVTVTGSGSSWTNNGWLYIGEQGIGTMRIEDGGAVITNGNASIGRVSGGVGTATVTGSGSTWTTNSFLKLGDLTGGQGTLTIANQGTVISNSQVRLADAPGTQGTALVTGTGSKWIGPATQFHVGFWDKGVLTIADGGEVQSDFTTLGTWGGSSGTATVTGGGSVWNIHDDFEVGVWGAGLLTIENGGLVTNPAAAYIGSEVGSVGVVTVTGAGSLWRPENEMVIGSEGKGWLTVTDSAAVETNEVHIAELAGSQGTVNIGSPTGDAPTAPGKLNTPLVRFGDGDGSLIFNHTASAYRFAPQILGNGRINLLAGTTELNNGAAFSGTVSVNSGAVLITHGTLGGTLGVLAGGRLEGAGTVGTTTMGGTVAPGNSIGTLHVAGNYTQAAGSTYEVEVDAAGNADLIDVSGTATLNGGTVQVISSSDFALATPYTILTSAGGVTGTFDAAAVSFSSPFLTPQLTYDTNDVAVAFTQTSSFASAALTPNQEAAAEGADSLDVGNAVWDAIALLPSSSDAPAAFDALSGEVHASTKSVLIEDSRFVREAAGARLRAAFAGVGAKSMPVLIYGDDDPAPALADTDRFAAWGHAFGSWGKWDGDGNAASLRRNTGGFVLGGDMEAANNWRLGLLAGYSRSSFDIDDRTSSGSADSYHLGAYAGTEIGKLGLRFGTAYSWHDVDTTRTAAFSGFTDTLDADYDAATAQFFGEAGYRIDTALARFEPFANLAYVNLRTDGFTESGGPAALKAPSSRNDATFTTLGLRAETALSLDDTTARLHGTLGWRHTFGDKTPTADLAFAGGDAFAIAGVPIAKDAAVIEAGLDLALSPNASLVIAYSGQIGGGVSDHGLKVNFSMAF
ncbi:autotransporter domain-containing protein [Allopusillimonas soli]|nr:autotransporter domain-containing protein [Allopusillimonas soli]